MMHCGIIGLILKLLWECPHIDFFYGNACHFPIEIQYRALWAIKHVNLSLETAIGLRCLHISELKEVW